MAKLSIGAIPKPVQMVLTFIFPALFAFLLIYFMILPNSQQIDGLNKDISLQNDEIAKSQSMVTRLDVLVVENNNLKNRLKELNKQLPEEREISVLLKQVSDKGAESRLKILTWKPSPRKLHPSRIVYEVPVTVTLQGSYHRLGNFFSSLTMLDRIVNIGDIKLMSPKPSGRDEAMLDVSFIATTFTASDEGGLSNTTGADTTPKPAAEKK